MIEARKKQVRREISALTSVNLAVNGGEKGQERLQYLNDLLGQLEGRDVKEERVNEAWANLRLKGRG